MLKTLSLSKSLNNVTNFGVYDYRLTELTACDMHSRYFISRS